VADEALSLRTLRGETSIYLEVVEARPVFLVVGAVMVLTSFRELRS